MLEMLGLTFVIFVAVIIFLLLIWKVAKVDQVLIVTGLRKKPLVKISGGAFVVPFFQKYSFFSLSMLTISSGNDEIKTTTGVPVVVDWTAQLRPNVEDVDQLKSAAISFLGRSSKEIQDVIKFTLDGGVREVVSALTPEEVLREKEAFSKKVADSVADEMKNMGFKLVSLNIQEVSDTFGYFDHVATRDRETKRKEAETFKAQADQTVREKKAEAEKLARESVCKLQKRNKTWHSRLEKLILLKKNRKIWRLSRI